MSGQQSLARHAGYESVADNPPEACGGSSPSASDWSVRTDKTRAASSEPASAARAARPAFLLATVCVVGALGALAFFGGYHTRRASAGLVHREAAFEVKSSGDGLSLESPGTDCGFGAISNFSSLEQMTAAGWRFSWQDKYVFKPARALFAVGVAETTYWGFRSRGDGRLSLRLAGEGILTVNFGNSWPDPSGNVTVALKGSKVASARAGQLSKTARMVFHDGDLLEIEEATAVIVLSAVHVECTNSPAHSSGGRQSQDLLASESGGDVADLENKLLQRQQEEQEGFLDLEDATSDSPAPSPSKPAGAREDPEAQETMDLRDRSRRPEAGTTSRLAEASDPAAALAAAGDRARPVAKADSTEAPPHKLVLSIQATTSTLTDTTVSTTSIGTQGPSTLFCNRSATFPYEMRRRPFDMPEKWRKGCENLAERPDDDDVKEDYPGRNWCWAWLKVQGCYWTRSHWSWWEAQERIATEGHAPDPHSIPFEPLLNASICERRMLGASAQFSDAELTEAQHWVNAHVAIYVLNLPHDRDRWSKMQRRLRSIGLEAQRVSGIDFAEPGAFQTCRKEGLIPDSYDLEEAEQDAERAMGGIVGTVGCASAHFRALRAAASGGDLQLDRPLALILEDDAELEDGFPAKLRMLLNEVPCDWSAMSLKTRCPYGACVSPHLTRVWPDRNEPERMCRHGVNYGFYAMLYRREALPKVFSALQETVWQRSRPRCLDIDVALASISDKIPYYAVPSLQLPGLVHEGNQGSARYKKNMKRLSKDELDEAPPAKVVEE